MMMEKQHFFPAFVPTDSLRVLVIGAGNIASRRIQALSKFSWSITVIAEHAAIEVEELSNSGEIRLIKRKASMEDVDGFHAVFACTDNSRLNADICEYCKTKGIPFNDCSNKNNCSFYFPGLVIKDNLIVGLTAGGKNHKAVKNARIIIEKALKMEENSSHE